VLYIYIYIYIYITKLATNEIFSPSNKIHWEVDRAKDLQHPCTESAGTQNLCHRQGHYLAASQHKDQGSVSWFIMWKFWSTKLIWDFNFPQPIVIPAVTSTFNRDHVMVQGAHLWLQ
jgi:hypothetical protein